MYKYWKWHLHLTWDDVDGWDWVFLGVDVDSIDRQIKYTPLKAFPRDSSSLPNVITSNVQRRCLVNSLKRRKKTVRTSSSVCRRKIYWMLLACDEGDSACHKHFATKLGLPKEMDDSNHSWGDSWAWAFGTMIVLPSAFVTICFQRSFGPN